MKRTSKRSSSFAPRCMPVIAALLVMTASMAVLPAGVAAKATPEQKCRGAKLAASQKLSACLLQARSRAALKNQPVDTSKCLTKFTTAFGKAEAKGGVACPTLGDASAIAAQIAALADGVAAAVAGQGPTPIIQAPTPTIQAPTPTPGATVVPTAPPPSIALNLTVNATYPRGPEYGFPLGTLNLSDPAASLVMPFDVTEGKTSRQIVSRIVDIDFDPVPQALLATHWSYWSDGGDHLADIFVCLAPNDTATIDPTALQGQTQMGATNVFSGPVINLAGTRGFVTVSTYESDPMASICLPLDPSARFEDPSIVGAWTIGSTVHPGAIGGSAVGLAEFPDQHVLNGDFGFDGGLAIQTVDPALLIHSQVILIGLERAAGNGQFFEIEDGPIGRPLPTGPNVCCDARFIDDVGTQISLPSVCFGAAFFGSMTAGGSNDTAVIPSSVSASTPGTVRLTGCAAIIDSVGTVGLIGTGEFSQFIIGFHGQTIP